MTNSPTAPSVDHPAGDHLAVDGLGSDDREYSDPASDPGAQWLNPHWVEPFRRVFSLCQARSDEAIVVLGESGGQIRNRALARLALEQLDLPYRELTLPATPIPAGPIIRSTGASLALDGQIAAVEQLCQADFIIDLTIEGLMHTRATGQILGSGARILNISNEHPETLARLVPVEDDKGEVKGAIAQCRAANTMAVRSEAGTDLLVDLAKTPCVGIWGWTDRPGTLAHWPGGIVVCFPPANSVNGTIVLAPGDINLTFKRYLESAVKLTIKNDFVVDIDGSGADAQLMRRYLSGFDEADAYATSHVGWGLNRRARYEALTMYDKSQTNGTELRALAGNFLYSTGSNEFARRFTRGHFDLPVMNCDILLDDEWVVRSGEVVS